MIWVGYACVGGVLLVLFVGEYLIRRHHLKDAKKWCKKVGIKYRRSDWL